MNIDELKAALVAGDEIVVDRGANLSGADLSRANLIGASLIGANLSKADLSKADLIGAKLIGANFSGANLLGANLIGANLIGANLIGANLIKANFSGANFSGANFSGADLFGANLIKANLSKANLSGADLRGAKLQRHLILVTPESIDLLLQFCKIIIDDNHLLMMDDVHHCPAGWICTLSPMGKLLEGLIGWNAAACLTVPIPEFTGLFYATEAEMLAFAAETLDDNGASLRAKYLA